VTQLISDVHHTGEWPLDVTELTMTLTAANRYKIQRQKQGWILRRTERKIEDVPGDQFG
jgi:hypothetical protein